MHCMTRVVCARWERARRDVGEEKTREYFRSPGSVASRSTSLLHDIQNNWYVVRK